jgi:ankyrin repeat protein
MIQPYEMKLDLPMEIANGVVSNTNDVWAMLVASTQGDLETIRRLSERCPELLYAKYNYILPIHFAVREGHEALVRYLLEQGAYDPAYNVYPFRETLPVIARDRGYEAMATMLETFSPLDQKFVSENGRIQYPRTNLQHAFEEAVDRGDFERTSELLHKHPEFAVDETYFWGEGILLFPAKYNDRPMIDLLMSHGAKVPYILKWTQFYYFEDEQGAAYMMEKGMNPNTMSCWHVTVLHDMAQKGHISKAELLLRHGADIDPVDEQYQSTPLGMAARWGQTDMVEYLLAQGADINKAGAPWATPLAWAKKKNHAAIEQMLLKAGAGK